MCNNCNCTQDAYDHCSIVGYMSLGHCCSLCAGYQERMTCEFYGGKLLQKLGLTSTDANIIAVTKKAEAKAKDQKATLIINKR